MKIEFEGNTALVVCDRCGYKEKCKDTLLMAEKISKEERITVIGEKEKEKQLLPTTKVICPNCGYSRAYYWEVQTRSGDEGTTQFFKCVKCGYIWRLYT